jgi:hypothetical protein
MPFYAVGPHHVFLSHDRWQALQNLALAHKSAMFRAQSMIAGFDAGREADELRFRCLQSLFARNASEFEGDWVQFIWRDTEARENVSDLIHDWCVLRKRGEIELTRSDVEGIFAEMAGDSYSYPFGHTFVLAIPLPRTFTEMILFRAPRCLRHQIDVRRITEVAGRLSRFTIRFDSYTLSFHDTIKLLDC